MKILYFLLATTLTVASGLVGKDEANTVSISFSSLEFFSKTSWSVNCMEEDKYRNDGSILIGSDHALQTTNGSVTTNLVTLAVVSGFTQINQTSLAFADSGTNCIKLLNRIENSIKTFAGTCGSFGNADGEVGVGKMYYPYGIEADIKNSDRLLITDILTSALRSVDMKTGDLSTVISEARFYEPWDIEKMGDNLYLVADTRNSKLKLMNMKKQIVGPVCFKGETPCTTSSVLPDNPRSLLNVEGIVYVGLKNGEIYKLNAEDIPPEVCQYTNITSLLPIGQTTVRVQLAHDSITLPEGVYKVTSENGSKICDYYVTVKESSIVRRLSFKSQYDVSCDKISNANSKNLLNVVLSHRRDQLQSICSQNCTMSTSIQPFYDCTNDLLTVYWPTDELYPATILEPPAVLSDELKKRLSDSGAVGLSEIFFPSHSPPLIAAKKNSKGEAVDIVLYSSCVDKKESYDGNSDTCS